MKKLLYKALYCCLRTYDWCKVYMLLVFYWSPWGRAYIVTAFKKYLESDWYSERSSVFVKRRAFEMYFENDESWFFKRQISTKERVCMSFVPFTYIRRAQKTVYEKGLIEYV